MEISVEADNAPAGYRLRLSSKVLIKWWSQLDGAIELETSSRGPPAARPKSQSLVSISAHLTCNNARFVANTKAAKSAACNFCVFSKVKMMAKAKAPPPLCEPFFVLSSVSSYRNQVTLYSE